MGADLAYIGSPFIATEEANAQDDYKRMIVEGGAMDIVTSSLFTGVSGNYLAPSIRKAGLDPPQTGARAPRDGTPTVARPSKAARSSPLRASAAPRSPHASRSGRW